MENITTSFTGVKEQGDSIGVCVFSIHKSFKEFKEEIISKYNLQGFDDIKCENKHLVTVICKCNKQWHIDSEDNYKDTTCSDCGKIILQIKK